MPLDKDFHLRTHFQRMPEFAPYSQALGEFVMSWNQAEFAYGVILQKLIDDYAVASVLTSKLGNQSKADVFMALAKLRFTDEATLDFYKFITESFGLIKDNRNSLVHAYAVQVDPKEPKPKWLRASTNPNTGYVYCSADLADIAKNRNAAERLFKALMNLTGLFAVPSGETLLDKFELPDRMTPHSVARRKW